MALAVLLWFHAVTEHQYDRELEIPLKVEDPTSESADQQLMVANSVPTHVTALVSGHGKQLLRLSSEDLLLRLRPDGSVGSARSYRLLPTDVEMGTSELGVQVKNIVNPREVQILLDHRDHKSVEVRPVVRIEVAEAYTQIGDIVIEPEQVEISGPSGQLEELEFIVTDSLSRTNVTEEIDEPLFLATPRGTRLEVTPASVRVRVDVQALAENDIDNVPIEVRHARGVGVAAQPSTARVKVKGGLNVIASLNPQKDLTLYVDYRDYDGQSLPVLVAGDNRFEVIQVVPAEIELIER